MAQNNKSSETSQLITTQAHPFYQHYNDPSYIIQHGVFPKIVVEENRRKYTLDNDEHKELVVYHIDGGVLQGVKAGEKKCDYGIYTQDKLLILVELKGTDYQKAIEQILNTITALGVPGSTLINKLQARVVVSDGRNVPGIQSSEYRALRRLLKQYKGNIITKSRQLSERLSLIQ